MRILSTTLAAGTIFIATLPARAQTPAPLEPLPQLRPVGQMPQAGQIGQMQQLRPLSQQLQQMSQQLQQLDLVELSPELFAFQTAPVPAVPAPPARPATPATRVRAGQGISLAQGEPLPPEKVTVPFRNGSQPRKLIVDAMAGSVTVHGYSGQDAIIEATGRSARNVLKLVGQPPAGMHKIGGAAEGLDVNEDNNIIRINTGMYGGAVDLDIQVPPQTAVSVKTLNGRQIKIENISGEIEVDNLSGDIQIVNASGSVMAHSMNGKVNVSLDSVMHDKPMSFSTMNGSVDVTLPSNIKANVKLKTDRGEMYTDFDIQLDPASKPQGTNGSYNNANRDQVTSGKINGGGPEIQFTTFNGNILIHKK